MERAASGNDADALAGNQLIVADGWRLLFWNNPPNLSNGQTADGTVGAADPLLREQPFFGRIFP